MPRKRMISPEFFTSRTMNDLPIATMTTFAGLWCYADDAGRGEDDEVMVKAAVWPRRRQMTESKVRASIDELSETGVICLYEVNGFALLHVTGWSEHQKISHATKSKLPPCPTHEPEAWEMFRSGIDPALDKFRNPSRAALEDSGATPSQCSSTQSNSTKSKGGSGTSPRGGHLGLASNG